MEYYGKILCISVGDLTREGADGSGAIMSMANYKMLCRRGQLNVVRPGKGLGSYALVEVATMPKRFRDAVAERYGDGSDHMLLDWFGQHWQMDAKARDFYASYRFADGSSLPAEHVMQYTRDASTLKAVADLMADTRAMRKAMQGEGVNWSEMLGALRYYQEQFGHSLPLSPARFKAKVREFAEGGYETLISKKFKNDNSRKVSYKIERLIMSLDSLPERPYGSTVAELYNSFVTGSLHVVDPESGEMFDPDDFTNKKGDPVVLSEATIAYYLNKPKNKALRAKVHDGQWEFNNEYRPHHLRRSPQWAFSKVSADDRDLPRKMHNGQRVKAYYVYDVASGCVVGYAYNRLKTADLFIDCMRNMFRTIERNGWCMPAQIEVEHHLVSNFADGLMKAGTVFPLVRWCNPGNSQEKRAEHLNRAKKYGTEKRLQAGIGRWYSKLEANRPKTEKVYDEYNNTYKEKTYSYDELVADDIRAIDEYNHQPHPNQKRYPGMTRWDVLTEMQNPDLAPVDKAVLYRYIGEHTETSVRRNMYCTVQYGEYALPTPQEIGKLEPRNMKVDAYYLPDEEGKVSEVYLYQNGAYITRCEQVTRYNEATAEQTEADRAAYTEQSKYVAQFDKMMRDEKIQRVTVIHAEEADDIEQAMQAAAEVESLVCTGRGSHPHVAPQSSEEAEPESLMPPPSAQSVRITPQSADDDDDLSEWMDASAWRGKGLNSI